MKKALTLLLVLIIAIFSVSCGEASVSEALPKAQVNAVSTTGQTPVPTPVPDDGIKSDGLLHVYLIGAGEKVLCPETSFIDYITYYADNDHLIICMKGKEYVYANVDSSTWDSFKAAESKGEFFNSEISGKAEYLVDDYDGSNGSLIVMDYFD